MYNVWPFRMAINVIVATVMVLTDLMAVDATPTAEETTLRSAEDGGVIPYMNSMQVHQYTKSEDLFKYKYCI